MNTFSYAELSDKKEKAKKRSLQWLFSNTANETVVHRISDRRSAGVCTTNDKNTTAGTGGHQGNDRDGLLGSLLIEQFLSAVFCPFLPSLLQAVDISTTIDLADEFWMDRRTARADVPPEASYFPSYC